jgi:hypothetical protein
VRATRYDRLHHFGTYLAAHQRAHSWVHKALAYRSAGKSAQAQATAQNVIHWLRRILVLEARVASG